MKSFDQFLTENPLVALAVRGAATGMGRKALKNRKEKEEDPPKVDTDAYLKRNRTPINHGPEKLSYP